MFQTSYNAEKPYLYQIVLPKNYYSNKSLIFSTGGKAEIVTRRELQTITWTALEEGEYLVYFCGPDEYKISHLLRNEYMHTDLIEPATSGQSGFRTYANPDDPEIREILLECLAPG